MKRYILDVLISDDIINIEHLVNAYHSHGFELRLVGGCVRDLIIGKKPNDIDLCTDATPEQSIKIIKEIKGAKYAETGLQHGTITAILNHIGYEITTLRIDTETDGRHAAVSFTKSFKEDAARRDFTFNAMSADIEGNVYDYFNGQEDLENGVIRFVGNTEDRVTEDYLRIMRFYRFMARYGFTGAEDVNEVFLEHFHKLDQISRERKWSEMEIILTSRYKVTALHHMKMIGVLNYFGCSWNGRVSYADDAATSLASLMCRDPDKHFRLTLADKAKFEWIKKNYVVSLPMSDLEITKYVIRNGVNPDWVASKLMLDHGNSVSISPQAYAYSLRAKPLPKFPITGHDLINKGVFPGKEMGEMINFLKNRWVDSDFKLTKEELLSDGM